MFLTKPDDSANPLPPCNVIACCQGPSDQSKAIKLKNLLEVNWWFIANISWQKENAVSEVPILKQKWVLFQNGINTGVFILHFF